MSRDADTAPDFALSSWELRARRARELAAMLADPNRDPLIGKTCGSEAQAEAYLASIAAQERPS